MATDGDGRPVFDYLLLKLASRCNLDCTYCYWFRDPTVREQPPVLTPETERALCRELERHVERYELPAFTVLFHGGEPLLFGKARFVALLDELVEIGRRTDCRINASITTNGALVDEEWARLFRIYGVDVTVSVDGPPDVHDRNRVDHYGEGSYDRVRRGIEHLQAQSIDPFLLAVCDPASDPRALCEHFVDEIGVTRFDVLVPDATHADAPPSIADYYRRLFDCWYDTYADRDVSIRYLEALLEAVLGGTPQCEAIGYGPIQLVTMLTDGRLEPLDVLRIAGAGSTRTGVSIHTHSLQDVADDPVWRAAYEASLTLAEACQRCPHQRACGGGYLPHRWSPAAGYDNPSVYCDDLLALFEHVWGRVGDDVLFVDDDGTRTSLGVAANSNG